MRKFQNIVSNFGNVAINVVVRQGNLLVVRIESLRSLRASSDALLDASSIASWLVGYAWQGLACTWIKPRAGFAMAVNAVVTPDQRRHQIMCHRTAA